MRYIAAYCMVALAGKSPSEADVKKVLEAASVEVDDAKLKAVCDGLKGKSLHEVIAAGMKTVGSMSMGGGGSSSSSAPAPAKTDAKKEAPKKEEEPEEEADADMGGLFGDDDF